MELWSREMKVIVISSLITLLCILLGTLLYVVFVPHIIVSMHLGESVEILNNIVKNRRRPLEMYFLYGRIIFSRVLVICVGVYLIVIISLLHRHVLSYMQEFWLMCSYRAYCNNMAV
jgi:hypothetical protein